MRLKRNHQTDSGGKKNRSRGEAVRCAGKAACVPVGRRGAVRQSVMPHSIPHRVPPSCVGRTITYSRHASVEPSLVSVIHYNIRRYHSRSRSYAILSSFTDRCHRYRRHRRLVRARTSKLIQHTVQHRRAREVCTYGVSSDPMQTLE